MPKNDWSAFTRDIMATAERMATAVAYGGNFNPFWALVIAQGILAERNRCAAVARANAHADCDVAEQIEKQILNP